MSASRAQRRGRFNAVAQIATRWRSQLPLVVALRVSAGTSRSEGHNPCPHAQGYIGPGLHLLQGNSVNTNCRNAISALQLPWICRAIRPSGATEPSVSV